MADFDLDEKLGGQVVPHVSLQPPLFNLDVKESGVGAVPPVIPAVITVLDFSPPVDTLIAFNQPVTFDVRSDKAFSRIMVAVKFANFGFTDLAYSQDPAGLSATVFESAYALSSTVVVVTDPGFFRFEFSLLRTPAWPESPEVTVYAVANDGTDL